MLTSSSLETTSKNNSNDDRLENAALAIIKKNRKRFLTYHSDVETRLSKRPLFVLDLSGSMAGTSSGKPKYIHLREAIAQFAGVPYICFHSTVFSLNHMVEPGGSTEMHAAFEAAKNHESDSLILISDGMPDNPELAISTAVALGVPVNVIFIGDPTNFHDANGEAFMKKLAEATGGQQFTADSNGQLALGEAIASRVRGLLTSSSSSADNAKASGAPTSPVIML